MQSVQDTPLSQEEIAEFEAKRKKQKKALEKHYDDEIPFLKKQALYEELITRIDVANMTRFEIMMAKAQMTPKKEDGSPEGPQRPEK